MTITVLFICMHAYCNIRAVISKQFHNIFDILPINQRQIYSLNSRDHSEKKVTSKQAISACFKTRDNPDIKAATWRQ